MAELTDARQKYEASRRNQATMTQVETLLEREAQGVLALGATLDRQAMGGFLRQIVPVLIDKYGNINSVAAMQYYDEQRLAWLKRNPAAFSTITSRSARGNRSRQAERFAAAKLKSATYVATMPSFNAGAIADPIVGYSMARFTESGFAAMTDQLTSAMTRAVASYNRDTILYNAGLDDAVVSVQRVAEPDACAFCALMAFGSGTGNTNPRTASYAIDFHDRCRCSIETLYIGDKPIRPPYYDKFEAEYIDNYDGTVTGTLSEWRATTGRN
jgi:hypothetical protein